MEGDNQSTSAHLLELCPFGPPLAAVRGPWAMPLTAEMLSQSTCQLILFCFFQALGPRGSG